MIRNGLLYMVVIAFVFETSQAQSEPVLTFSVPAQNNLLFNRFLINPTFSIVRENDNYISLYHRNQWIQFNDSPELYLLSYAGKFSDKSGSGIGLYQQNLGIISSFGGVANYAYQLPLSEKMALAVGFNLAYYTTGINSNRAVGNEPDPAILELANNSVLTLKPGFAFSWGSFDVGVYAENLVDYNFKTSEMVQNNSNTSISAHALYHHRLETQKGLFENGYFQLMALGKNTAIEGFRLGGAMLVNFPYMGWVQTGLDDYYGISVGVGAHLSHRLSLGYTYERIIADGAINFGPTHEITLAFRLSTKNNRPITRAFDNTKKTEKPLAQKPVMAEDAMLTETEPLATTKDNTSENGMSATAAKALEIEKLKMTLTDSNLRLLEWIVKEDSIQKIKWDDFEKRLNNLTNYIKRVEKTNPKNQSTDSNEMEEKTVVTTTTTTTKKGGQPTPLQEKQRPFEETIPKSNTAKDEPFASNTKLAALKPNAQKETQSGKPVFTLNEEEIKHYYSTLTSKQRETAKKNYIEITNQEPGFYVVANVFSNTDGAINFINQLKKKGMQASYFTNPKNNFKYVYLRKLNTWQEALIAYYGNVDNTYFETIWIMNINIK